MKIGSESSLWIKLDQFLPPSPLNSMIDIDHQLRPHRRSLVVNAILVIAAVSLALVSGELIARLSYPNLIKPDPILGHIARPINDRDRDGFRNAAILPQADIVALGDSQTEGNNATLEEAWPQVLGRLASTTAYQLALGGWGPAQAYHLLDRALALKPRTIIFGFYFGNDLLDTYNLVYQNDYWRDWRQVADHPAATSSDAVDYRLVLQSGLKPDSWQLRLLALRTWFRRHFKLYELAGNASRSWRERLNLASDKNEKQAKVENFARERPDLAYFFADEPIASILSPGYRQDAIDLDQPRASEGWRLTRQFLLAMNDRIKTAGVDFVVAMIPTKEMVYLTHLRRTGREVPVVFADYYAKEVALLQAVEDFCRSERLRCVFTLPALAAALDRGEIIYGRTMDGHPVPAGYRLIAETLYSELKF
jgi:hypothetical protein